MLGHHQRLKPLLIGCVLLAGGCGDDDPRPAGGDSGPDTVDLQDVSADTAEEPGDAGEDIAETTPADTPSYPDLPLGPQLPVAADFDSDYVGVGDAVVTTLVETLKPRHGYVPHVDADGRLLAPMAEFGRLHPQPGESHVVRHQLALPSELGAADLVAGALGSAARSHFYGFIMADPQLVDMDSPSQIAKNALDLGSFSLPAYRDQAEFGVHFMDALVRSADAFQADRRFDLVMVAGDLAENGSFNELDWFFTGMNGGELSADSGPRSDVVAGPANDAFDPFIAKGFSPGTPWITTAGNHDILINGNFPAGLILEANDPVVLPELESIFGPFGLTVPGVPTSDLHPAYFPHQLRSAFRVDVDDFHLLQLTGVEELAALGAATVETDERRDTMSLCDFVDLHANAGGAPENHGFTQQNLDDCTGWFVVEPVAGVPLRVISLALGPSEGGSQGILSPPYRDGMPLADRVGDPRWDQVAFLEAELARAEQDGVAVIVLTHQGSGAIVSAPAIRALAVVASDAPLVLALIDEWLPTPVDPVTTDEFRAILSGSPNVIAHIAGHSHRNAIRAICADGSQRGAGDAACAAGPAGETGYWEIITSAGIAFPHQGRFIELVQIDDQLAGLYLTMLDPRIPAGSFTDRGRFISKAVEAVGSGGAGRMGQRGDRNVLLPIALPAAVAAAFSATDGAARIESETSLLDSKPALPALPVWTQ